MHLPRLTYKCRDSCTLQAGPITIVAVVGYLTVTKADVIETPATTG